MFVFERKRVKSRVHQCEMIFGEEMIITRQDRADTNDNNLPGKRLKIHRCVSLFIINTTGAGTSCEIINSTQ